MTAARTAQNNKFNERKKYICTSFYILVHFQKMDNPVTLDKLNIFTSDIKIPYYLAVLALPFRPTTLIEVAVYVIHVL